MIIETFKNATIINEDCFNALPNLNNKVDLILSDPPYNITACDWDKSIDLNKLWVELKKLGKENTPYIFTASQPFTTDLINSNRDWFRYEYIWIKTKASNFQNARRMPMKRHENILVFYKTLPTFNNNLTELGKPLKNSRKNKGSNLGHCVDSGNYFQEEAGFKTSDIYFANPSGAGHLHPTQKPVDLMEYLIETYTNENDIVLDPFAGSFTTAIACLNSNRKFIGIELSKEYYEIGKKRIVDFTEQSKLF
ncbi:MAG: site-specific DNA-methyltransferase [Candidatus Paceibacterota bacterium]|jgi:site-specific DNA-methyltransferase (adenine-specific)